MMRSSSTPERRSRLLTRPAHIWSSATLQFIFFALLPVTAVLLALAFGSVSLHQQAMRSLVGERDERAAATAAIALSEQIQHRVASVQTLALRARDGARPEEILRSTPTLATDFDLGMAIFSRTGRILAARGPVENWLAPEDPALAAAVKAALARADAAPSLETLLSEDESGENMILIAARADEKGAVAAAFSLENLANAILPEAFDLSSRSTALLMDATGRPIYLAGNADAPIEISDALPTMEEALKTEHSTVFLNTSQGEYVITFSRVDATNWLLVLAEPWEDVTNPFLRRTLLAPLVLAPVIVLAFAALWFGLQRIIRPLRSLETKAAALAWGDYEPIETPVGGIVEIQQLQSELIHLAHKVRRAQQNLRSYIGAITAGQEEERKRLARELHDDTLQALIALNQRVQLAQLNANDPETAKALREVQALASETIANLRRFVRALRPVYLEDLGLVTALDMLVRETAAATGAQARFHCIGEPRRFPPNVELALYRMAQEALSNVARHANAQHIQVTAAFSATTFTLKVRDDGRGFVVPDSPAEFAQRGHFGLLGLQERAELIGAHLSVISQPGQGAEVSIVLSYDAAP
ncbi:MAG: hypothetical protein GXP42_08005 [Chloroflexi bacterium]|nr:hypothetical protein [Chloroflexota bacterium]